MAKWIRHRSSKPGIAGSTPARGTFVRYSLAGYDGRNLIHWRIIKKLNLSHVNSIEHDIDYIMWNLIISLISRFNKNVDYREKKQKNLLFLFTISTFYSAISTFYSIMNIPFVPIYRDLYLVLAPMHYLSSHPHLSLLDHILASL